MAAKQPITLDSFFECPICLGDFDDPRVLPCLHTLCMKCLQEHVSLSSQGDKFLCPSCRGECHIPTEGLGALPKNFFLNSLMEYWEAAETKTESDEKTSETVEGTRKKKCQKLKTIDTPHGDATVFCEDCDQFCCEACASYHNGFVSSQHSMRPANEVDQSEINKDHLFQKTRRCAQHPKFDLDFYCDECGIPVCTKCCLLKHKQHAYRDLSAAGEECQERLSLLVQETTERVHQLRQHCSRLEDSQRNLLKDFTLAREELHRTANEIKDMITKRELFLMEELGENEQTAQESVRAAQKETELNMASTESLLSFMQPLQASGTDLDKVLHTPGLQRLLKQQQGSHSFDVCWTANVERKSIRSATLGTVRMTSRSTGSNLPFESLKTSQQTLKPDVGDYVVGLVVAGSVICAVGSGQPYLWVHNPVVNKDKQHQLTGLQAAGMTRVKDKDIEDTEDTLRVVISDRRKKLHFITINKSSLDIIEHTTEDLDIYPYRISTDCETGRLIFTDRENDRIQLSDDTGKSSIPTSVSSMIFVATTSGGYVVVQNGREGRVHWVNDRGKVTQTYGLLSDQSLRYPQQVAEDSQGRFVVVDNGNHRLHLLDARGRLCGYLLTEDDGLQHPSSVCLDESSGRLYVAHGSHPNPELRVYKWEPCNVTQTWHTLSVQLGGY